MRSFSAMDAYKDSEPSRFASAARLAERPEPSSRAGEVEACCPNEKFAATARAPNAKHDNRDTHRVPWALRGLLGPAPKIFLDELGVEHRLGVVLRSVLDLLQIVQPAVLVDPVDRRDQPHRLLRNSVTLLVYRVRRHVDLILLH